jgi:hypothetical protein
MKHGLNTDRNGIPPPEIAKSKSVFVSVFHPWLNHFLPRATVTFELFPPRLVCLAPRPEK